MAPTVERGTTSSGPNTSTPRPAATKSFSRMTLRMHGTFASTSRASAFHVVGCWFARMGPDLGACQRGGACDEPFAGGGCAFMEHRGEEAYMKRSSVMGPTIPMAAHDTAAGDLTLARDGRQRLLPHSASSAGTRRLRRRSAAARACCRGRSWNRSFRIRALAAQAPDSTAAVRELATRSERCARGVGGSNSPEDVNLFRRYRRRSQVWDWTFRMRSLRRLTALSGG